MTEDEDYAFALQLQAQFETEAATEAPTIDLTYSKKGKKPNLNSSKSLVDPSWEVIDPTPDIHILFVAFNGRYFWNKLQSVCISWSKRMTTCAGICSYSGRAGLCKITLSEPLLKLRPRKDLVETMLHEMIHAYLFVTRNNRDRDGHGPEFHKHMYRINAEAGTNITVYHDFHDEVNLYKQHVWRCDGPCQRWKPYFGIVRRANNRAPGPYDRWFGEHSRNCGGNFKKIKEPEKVEKSSEKGKTSKKPSLDKPNQNKSLPDIRNFLKTPPNSTNSKISTSNNSKSPLIQSAIKNTNIHGFSNLDGANCSSSNNKENQPSTSKSNFVPFTGTGHKLLLNSPPELKRNLTSSIVDPINPKRLKKDNKVHCPVCDELFEMDELNRHLDGCLESKKDDRKCVLCFQNISKDVYEEHVLKCSEVEAEKPALKECPLCKMSISEADYDVHVADCLLNDFKHSEPKIVEISDSDSSSNDCVDIVNCLVCQKRILRIELNEHLDECVGDLFDKSKELNDSMAIADGSDESDSENGGWKPQSYYENIPEEAKAKFLPCPVCFKMFPCYVIDSHIDECLK